MPALYRMPVFYLVLLVGIAAFALLGRAPGSSSSTGRPAEPLAARPAAAPPPAQDEAEERPDGILRTPDGLRRKVLVKDLDVVCRTDPGGGKAVGSPLDYFAILYVFGVQPADSPAHFLVGPQAGPPRGWVPGSAVLEWDTRLMARPTPHPGRPPLVIYREESCLIRSLDGSSCPTHRGGCPTEGEESESAVGKLGEDPADDGPPLGFPILSTKEVGGRTIHEVATLVKDRASRPILPAEPPPDLRRYLNVVDVAFAIDTTASMQLAIESARRLASDLVAATSRQFGDLTLRLALVEYRDGSRHYGFKARRVSSFTSPEGFLAALGRIRAADRGDGSVDESVLDGLELALPAQAGASSSEHVDWPTGRAGELATKLLVVLGDAPDHARDLERVRALAARARASGISIATVAIDSPGSLSRDERSRYLAQWRTMAEESYRPLARESAFAGPAEPLMATLDGGGLLVDRLRALIDDRVEHARTLAALATAEAEGRLADYVNSQGLTLDRVAPVLVDLHRGDGAAVARPDPRSEGRKAPSLRRGWVAEQVEGHPMVEIEILMSEVELKTLIDELSRLQQAASGTARDLAELLQIGTAAAAGEESFLSADRGKRTFAQHLRRRRGLPPARPDSLLSRSQSDLLRADGLSLAALDEKLRGCLARLTGRLLEPDWHDPRRTVDGMALVPYRVIDF